MIKKMVRLIARYLIPLLGIVLLMMFLLGFFRKDVIKGGRAPIPHKWATGLPSTSAVIEEIPLVQEATGTVAPEYKVTVAARITGHILKIDAAAGRYFKKGEIIAILDSSEIKTKIAQLKQALNKAKAILELAQSDYNRDKPLFEQKAIPAVEFDHTTAALRTAQAEVNRLKNAIKEAKVQLSYTVVKSPISGRVIDRIANVGDLAVPGKPLCTMYDEHHLWIEAEVPEDIATHIKLGDELSYEIEALNSKDRGKVVEIVPGENPATRTEIIRIRISHGKNVIPGMFSRVNLIVGKEKRVLIPANTVVKTGQLTTVDVIQNGEVFKRTVQLGRKVNDKYIVLSGLSGGEKLVIQKSPFETEVERGGIK